MARTRSELPTYEFANDPLPPRSNGRKGQADLDPRWLPTDDDRTPRRRGVQRKRAS